MRPRLTSALLGVAAVVAAAPTGASAHPSAPDVLSEIDGVSPTVPGLRVSIARSVTDQLAVSYRGTTPIEALDDRGRPFVRIGRDGVEADLASPAFFRSNDPTGQAGPPKGVRQDAPPKWRTISRDSSFAWFDHRLHPGGVRGDEEARRSGRPARLADVTVPLRQGGRPITVRGAVVYRPRLGSVSADLMGAQPPGVQASAIPGVRPGMLVTAVGEDPVSIDGPDGEPFARLDRRGVRVNQRSPLASTLSSGALPVREGTADPDAAPRWKRVSTSATLAWLDPRLQSEGAEPGYREARAGRTIVTARWSIPVSVGGSTSALRGSTLWRPTAAISGRLTDAAGADEGGSSVVLLGGIALLVVVGGGAGALLLRRRAAA